MHRAVVGGTVITMEGPIYSPGIILFKDGIILAVGVEVDLPSDTEIIAAPGRVIMPGLIDAHCHVGITEEIYPDEGDDLNEMSEPITPYLRALDGINPEDLAFTDALQAGITSLGILPGSANVIGGVSVVLKTWGSTVDQRVIRQPSGLKVALGENPKRVYRGKQKAPMTRMAIAGLLRKNLVAAQNYGGKRAAKLAKEGKQGEKPFVERDLDMEILLQALQGELPVKVHAHRADDIMTALRIGQEFGLQLTLEHGTEAHKILDELRSRQIPVVVGPSLSNRSKVELKELSFRTPGVLAQAGLKIAIMTDHPVIPIQYLPLCAALAVKAGLDPDEALRAITLNAAEILGVAHRVGSLAPGKDADLLVLSGSILHLDTQVEKVIINGQCVLSESRE